MIRILLVVSEEVTLFKAVLVVLQTESASRELKAV
jgi:hypothetical protein